MNLNMTFGQAQGVFGKNELLSKHMAPGPQRRGASRGTGPPGAWGPMQPHRLRSVALVFDSLLEKGSI